GPPGLLRDRPRRRGHPGRDRRTPNKPRRLTPTRPSPAYGTRGGAESGGRAIQGARDSGDARFKLSGGGRGKRWRGRGSRLGSGGGGRLRRTRGAGGGGWTGRVRLGRSPGRR